MSSNVINFMDRKYPDINILIEDFTDEFYETGTEQIKEWLVSNISNKSEKVIRDMDTDTLLDLFLETSIELMGMTLRHKNGRRG
ncbi:hypothetical protein N9A84_03265 [Gammaproteobacteria bacterium]|nr:hypothetical protein [Gammaproteobacteria bacterium]